MTLHQWLGTPDAYLAAQRACAIPLYKLPVRSEMIGRDELLSEALSILTECALESRDRITVLCAYCGGPMPEGQRRGAKYCSPKCSSSYRDQRARGYGKMARAEQAPAHPKTHIGSMWDWPADEMMAYAIREVGFRLCNYVRTGHLETPASQMLANLSVAEEVAVDATDIAIAWLELNGIKASGDETPEELLEAVQHVKAREEVAV